MVASVDSCPVLIELLFAGAAAKKKSSQQTGNKRDLGDGIRGDAEDCFKILLIIKHTVQ